MASLLPAWVAPNLVTFTGFTVALSNIFLFAYFNPTLDQVVPSWMFMYAGFTVFFYLTMDAIDGMQARKTKSSTPLGQLFDHGCDCMITTVFALMMINGLSLGPSWKSIALVACAQVTFFLSQWEEKYTGTCRTSVAGLFGVTEIQLMLMSQMFASAFYPSLGSMEVYQGWVYSDCFLLGYVGFMVLVDVSCIAGILFKCFSAFKELLAVLGLNVVVFVWALRWGLERDEYLLAMLTLAFCNSFSTIRVILSTITATKFPLYHPVAIPYFALAIGRVLYGPGPWVQVAFAIYLGGQLDHIIKALVGIVNEISCYLGIYVFNISSKRD